MHNTAIDTDDDTHYLLQITAYRFIGLSVVSRYVLAQKKYSCNCFVHVQGLDIQYIETGQSTHWPHKPLTATFKQKTLKRDVFLFSALQKPAIHSIYHRTTMLSCITLSVVCTHYIASSTGSAHSPHIFSTAKRNTFSPPSPLRPPRRYFYKHGTVFTSISSCICT